MDLTNLLQICHRTYQAGDLAKAEQQYMQIIKKFPSATDAYHLGALIAARSGELPVAYQRIETAISGQKEHFEYWNTKGNILSALQVVPSAIEAYNKSLQYKPDYLQAAVNLGKCLLDNDDPETAINVYKRALVHHPANQQLQIGHVIALKSAVRSEEALAALDALNKENDYHFLRAQTLMQMGRHKEAIEINNKALSDPVSEAPALKNIMQSYWMLGEWEAGERRLNETLQNESATVGMYISAVYIFLRAGKLDTAVAIVESAQLKFGETPDILITRAQLALERGEKEQAWQYALKALQNRPGDLALMEIFAEAALVSGRPNDAMVAAQEALKVLPNNQYWIAVKYTAGRVLGQDYRYYADTERFVRPYKIVPPEKYESVEVFNAELKAALESLHRFDQHPLDQSLRLGTQTPTDLRFAKIPVIQDFFKALDAPIKDYMSRLGQNPNHPLDRRNTGKYRLAGAWSVQLRAGGFHVDHVHPKGWLSSSYYVDVPAQVEDEESKKGWIQFGQPPFDLQDQRGNPILPDRIIKPEPGMLVLFPSYLWHGTIPIEGDATRLTLPFDVVPA